LYVLLPSALIVAGFLIWAGESREILFLTLGFSTTAIAVHVAKLIFRRPRPDSLVHLVPMPADWSFPSGHTAQATAFFLAVTLIAFRILPPFWATLTALFSLLIVIGVGYSRIYLQVHYLSDVLAGVALAVFLVVVVNALLPNRYLPFGK
jgi:membrane-associated phospholipid phosphatase